MAGRKGKFGSVSTDPTYAGDVIKNINKLNKGSTTTQKAALKPSTMTPDQRAQKMDQLQYMKEYRQLQTAMMGGYNPFAKSAEEIAADPTLSALQSGTTLQQAQAGYQKALSVFSLMPSGSLATSGSAKDKALYDKQMAAFNAAYAKLTPEEKNAQNVYSALGGYVSTNDKPTYGWNAQDIAKTWASLGNLDKAREILGSVFGTNASGNPAGSLGSYGSSVQSPAANITAYQTPSGRLTLTPPKKKKKGP